MEIDYFSSLKLLKTRSKYSTFESQIVPELFKTIFRFKIVEDFDFYSAVFLNLW